MLHRSASARRGGQTAAMPMEVSCCCQAGWGGKNQTKPHKITPGRALVLALRSTDRNRDVATVTGWMLCTRCRSLQAEPSQEDNAAMLHVDVINEIPDLTLIMRLQSREGRGCFCFIGKPTKEKTFSPETTSPLERNSSSSALQNEAERDAEGGRGNHSVITGPKRGILLILQKIHQDRGLFKPFSFQQN